MADGLSLEIRELSMFTSHDVSSGLQSCRKAIILNKQSVGLLGKMCSVVNLFLVVQRDQHTTANPTQNILPWAPTRLEAKRRRCEKEAGLQETCSHDLIQHQKSLAKTQLKNI